MRSIDMGRASLGWQPYPIALGIVPPQDARPRISLGPPHPNPTSGALTFNVTLAGPEAARVELRDVARRLARNESLGGSGHNNVRLDLADLHAGVYFVRVTQGTDSATRRVVVLD